MCGARLEAVILRDSPGLRSEVQENDFGSLFDCPTRFWEFKTRYKVCLRILRVMKTSISFVVPFMLSLAVSAVGIAASRELLVNTPDPLFIVDPWTLGVKYALVEF